MLCLTTTAIDIDEELLNRCLVLTINETAEQTAAIQQRQRQARTLAGLQTKVRSEHILQAHRAAQTLLRPLAVVNPFAEQLSFASDRVRLRRDHVKYLALIDAIALLHQHQRPVQTVEVDGAAVEYIEVSRAISRWPTVLRMPCSAGRSMSCRRRRGGCWRRSMPG